MGIGLCTGRGSQAGSIYFFGFIFPLVFNRKDFSFSGIPMARIGFLLIALFYVFPLADMLQVFFSSEEIAAIPWSWSKILSESRFSSSLGITGILFLVIRLITKVGRRNSGTKPAVDVFGAFTFGLATGMALLLIYVLVQFFTGFNFSAVAAYRSDRMLGDHFYRATGFTNHPVSFAGWSLGILSFYWAYFCRCGWQSIGARFSFALGAIVALAALYIFLSGSRFAVVAAVLVIAGGLLTMGALTWRKRVALVGLAVLLSVGLIFVTGLNHRFAEMLSSSQESIFGDRMYFWQVHWALFKNSPLIGSGRYFTDALWRNREFDLLGYSSLKDKYNAHNLYLETLADVGVIGTALIGILSATAFRLFFRSLRSCRQSILAFCLAASIASNLLFGIAQNTFFDSPTMLITLAFFWMQIWQLNYDGVMEPPKP
jgi:O-antigen ligase